MRHARGTRLSSSGLSNVAKGSPYSIPIRRSAAARPSSPASGSQVRLDVGRRVTDEAGDVAGSDEHGVDARALERCELVARRHVQVGDRKLARGNVGQEVEQ